MKATRERLHPIGSEIETRDVWHIAQASGIAMNYVQAKTCADWIRHNLAETGMSITNLLAAIETWMEEQE